MENKKTKLTISGIAKKSIQNIEIVKTQGKNSVIIEKQPNKFPSRGGSFKPSGAKSTSSSFTSKEILIKPILNPKDPINSNDFERRKLAEQRATKRLKGESEEKEKKFKIGIKKEN